MKISEYGSTKSSVRHCSSKPGTGLPYTTGVSGTILAKYKKGEGATTHLNEYRAMGQMGLV